MATDEELIKELEQNIKMRALTIIMDLIKDKFQEEVDGKKVWKKKEYREVYDYLGFEPIVTERLELERSGW